MCCPMFTSNCYSELINHHKTQSRWTKLLPSSPAQLVTNLIISIILTSAQQQQPVSATTTNNLSKLAQNPFKSIIHIFYTNVLNMTDKIQNSFKVFSIFPIKSCFVLMWPNYCDWNGVTVMSQCNIQICWSFATTIIQMPSFKLNTQVAIRSRSYTTVLMVHQAWSKNFLRGFKLGQMNPSMH